MRRALHEVYTARFSLSVVSKGRLMISTDQLIDLNLNSDLSHIPTSSTFINRRLSNLDLIYHFASFDLALTVPRAGGFFWV